jgi:hypothetical protein
VRPSAACCGAPPTCCSHEGGDPRAILHRRIDPVGNEARVRGPQPPHRLSWARCSATTSRRGSGRSNTCRGAVARTHGRRHRRAAGCAGGRKVIDDAVGFGNLPQGLAFGALLVSQLPAGPLGRTACPRQLLSPSLDGGVPLLPLLPLFRPSRCSNSRHGPSKPQSPPLAPGSARSTPPALVQTANRHS